MLNIGIDLGGTNIVAAAVNDNGEILHSRTVPCQTSNGREHLTGLIRKVVLDVMSEAGLDFSDINSVGMGVPGTTNPKEKSLCHASNLSLLDGMKMHDLFPELPLEKLFIENDANAAALGEVIAGCAKGCKDVVMLTLGTGVGSGIIIDGKIYGGFNGAAGEAGHMTIVHNGRKCPCGRKGCWEQYASATGLIKSTREAMELHKESLLWQLCDGNPENVNGKTVFDAKLLGDQCAAEVVNEYIDILAAGIINIILLLQPEKIILGGGVAKQKDVLTVPIREIYEREKYKLNGKYTEITFSDCGNAGLIGAAMLGK